MITGHFNFHLCTQPHFLNSLIWILVCRNDGYLKSGYTVIICILFNSGLFSYLHILLSLHNSILVSNSSIIQEFIVNMSNKNFHYTRQIFQTGGHRC